MKKVHVVDYGYNNIGSIVNMLIHIGVKPLVISNPCEINKIDYLVLPGIGSFDRGISELKKLNFIEFLNEYKLKERPLMGICLGMQMMTKFSEEGKFRGLGWFDAQTIKFKFDTSLKLTVPHMGWNKINVAKNNSLFCNIENLHRFYFVHSYYVECNCKADILATTKYGKQFVSAIQKDNLIGLQFHPEKSLSHGIKVFKNLVKT
tara:strand:- start:8498 stop:9112 length:615 start_codon:yes stop_codon:yes gene_type:complete